MKKPVPIGFERGGCSQATGASFRSMRPTEPRGLFSACALHDEG